MGLRSLKVYFSVTGRTLSGVSSFPKSPTSPGEDTNDSDTKDSNAKNSDAVLNTACRKVDARLLTWYTFVLILVRMTNHNIANAAIMNLEVGTNIKHQLGDLTEVQWASALSACHYPFIALEPISTLMLKRYTPRKWMGRIMISLGIISMCTSTVQGFGGLFACRFPLGAAEAGFMPGVLYHVSFWYHPERLPFRIALLCALLMIASTSSGLLAYAISFFNGKGGLPGWRWLFLMEGTPALLCGIWTFLWLPDYPEDAKFLNEAQRAAILANRGNSQPSSKDKTWDSQQTKGLFKDWSTYGFLMIWICHSIGSFSISAVYPTVIHDIGIASSAISQLMTMPGPVMGGCGLVVIAFRIHRKKLKPWRTAAFLDIGVVACYVALFVVRNPVARFISISLSIALAVGIMPILWPERLRAVGGTSSAGIAIGLTNAITSLPGIVGPHIYLARFAPKYRTSFGVSLGFVAAAIVSITVTKVLVCRKYGAKVKREKVDTEMTDMVDLRAAS